MTSTPFADLCQRAHPVNGNARALFAMIETDADLHYLAAAADGFSEEARAELGDRLIAAWCARGNRGEAAVVARDPVFRDVVSMSALVMSGATEEVNERRRKLIMDCVRVDSADADSMDEIDHLSHWSEAR